MQSQWGAILWCARNPSFDRHWWSRRRSKLKLHIWPLGNCCMYFGWTQTFQPEHSYTVPGMGLCLMYYVRTHANTNKHTHQHTQTNTRMCTHIHTHLLILQYFSDPNLGGFQEIHDFCPINIVSNYTVTASARYYNSSRTLEIHISVDINCWYTYFYLITCRH